MADDECWDGGNTSDSSYSYVGDSLDAGEKAHMSILIICFAIIAVVGIIGNVLVLFSLFMGTRKLGITSILLGSLAFSDFCINVWYVPMEIKFIIEPVWKFGPVLCYFTAFLGTFAQSSSAIMLLVISCERFLVILYPLTSRTMLTRKRTFMLVITAWLVSAGLAALPTSHKKVKFIPCSEDKVCTNDYTEFQRMFFYFYALFVLYLIPLGAIAIANTCVIRALIKSSRYTQKLQSVKCIEKGVKYSTASRNGEVSISSKPIYRNNNSNDVTADGNSTVDTVVASGSGDDPFPPVNKRKEKVKPAKNHSSVTQRKRVVVMLLSVVLLYATCWLPYFIFGMLYVIFKHPHSTFGMRIFESFAKLCYAANSALNPIVYGFMSKNFRQRVIHGLTRCLICPSRRKRAGSFGSAYTLSTRGSAVSHHHRQARYSALPKM